MIKIKLDKMMVDREISNKELAKLVGITESNLSNIKRSSVKEIRLSTLNSLCKHLKCQPRDLFEYIHDLED